MSIHALHDDHGRTVRYLRLSLTDRCNLRCLYCHSNARHQCIPHEKVLRYEEMIRLVQIVRGMGVGKVRLTGGEPFARKGCDDFLLRLRQRFDDLDIRITTNGTLLEEHIPLLQRIRISAVNLSLDSFDRETFARVTGRDMLSEVLRALDAMLAAGIRVKINAVGLRGINDGQLADFVHAAMTLPVDVRFIEFMPMGSDTLWSPENFWPASDIRAAVEQHVRLVPLGDANEGQRGPARMFALESGKGRMGFITPLTNHFCLSCNRLRMTSDGHLRTCLFGSIRCGPCCVIPRSRMSISPGSSPRPARASPWARICWRPGRGALWPAARWSPSAARAGRSCRTARCPAGWGGRHNRPCHIY